MSRIENFFLRAKHWQIFLIFAVGFVLSPIGLLGSDKGLYIFFAITIVFGSMFSAWLWSMGSFLYGRAQGRLHLSEAFFGIALIFPVLYVLFFAMIFEDITPSTFWLVYALDAFAAACMIYSMYFVSKSLIWAETRKRALFSRYIRVFLLLWFHPIGVWFIQPRINRLYAETKLTGFEAKP